MADQNIYLSDLGAFGGTMPMDQAPGFSAPPAGMMMLGGPKPTERTALPMDALPAPAPTPAATPTISDPTIAAMAQTVGGDNAAMIAKLYAQAMGEKSKDRSVGDRLTYFVTHALPGIGATIATYAPGSANGGKAGVEAVQRSMDRARATDLSAAKVRAGNLRALAGLLANAGVADAANRKKQGEIEAIRRRHGISTSSAPATPGSPVAPPQVGIAAVGPSTPAPIVEPDSGGPSLATSPQTAPAVTPAAPADPRPASPVVNMPAEPAALTALKRERDMLAELATVDSKYKAQADEVEKRIAEHPGTIAAKEQAKLAATSQQSAIQSVPQVTDAATRTLKLIGEIENDTNLGRLTGIEAVGTDLIDGALKQIPFLGLQLPDAVLPSTHDIRAKIAQLQGGAFMQAFETLKGGGQITEIEGKKATEAINRLGNMKQSDAGYREALNDFRRIVIETSQNARKRAGLPPDQTLQSQMREKATPPPKASTAQTFYNALFGMEK